MCCLFFSGVVCASGSVPLSGLLVVSEGQEGEGRSLLVRPGHCTSVQQISQHCLGFLPLSYQAAQPAESSASGEVD